MDSQILCLVKFKLNFDEQAYIMFSVTLIQT